jgi:hypothetical protein
MELGKVNVHTLRYVIYVELSPKSAPRVAKLARSWQDATSTKTTHKYVTKLLYLSSKV